MGGGRTAAEDLHTERHLSIHDLRIVSFGEAQAVGAFSCGNKELDDFLTTGEVENYDREGLGKTYLVYCGGEMAAYFTVSFAELRVEYLRSWKSFSAMAERNLEAVPALKIGRLAVDSRFKRRGIGKALVRYIVGMALESTRTIGVRLIILQAKPESVPFYRDRLFEFAVETRRERKRINRTMFLDLQAVEDVG